MGNRNALIDFRNLLNPMYIRDKLEDACLVSDVCQALWEQCCKSNMQLEVSRVYYYH